MPVIFSPNSTIETTHEKLLASGFRCLNWNTIFECYSKEGENNVYRNTQLNLFFSNPGYHSSGLRIIIAGGMDFKDYDLLCDTMNKLLRKRTIDEVEIVCGEAPGADTLGKQYATENGIKVKSFPADWDGPGRAAGPIRNGQMAEYATHCVCFWDTRSKGTRDMIEKAKAKGLKLKIVHYE